MLKIYKLGEEVLRQKCEAVKAEEINDEFRALIKEMFLTMDEANGVGLAAPQVGIAKRFFVAMSDDDVERVFINPVITKTSSELSEYEEGCLSIPGVYETIVRPKAVTISALDINGKPFTLDAEGLLARIVQHESDHLDGVLYIDRGDEAFKEKTIETFKKRKANAAAKAAKKAAKKAHLEAKLNAKKQDGAN
ncbi:MAG TPA: peptide deformylase [Treponema sp.]|nr:peptide deformylase [Treponema sp.]